MRQALPSRAEWEALLVNEGSQGGMPASTASWVDMQAEHQGIAEELSSPPQSMHHVQQPRQDIADLTKHVICASKRKTVPQAALPLEILVMPLAPNYIRKAQKQDYTSRRN